MFNDKAGEAMEFYTSIIPNSQIVSTMPGPDGSVMGGSFEIEGQKFSCYNGGDQFSFSWGISLMINAETQDEIDMLYERLSEGGEQQPCGWVKDKYGLSWQITPPILMQLLGDPDREKAGRVMNAMLKMKKIIIADLDTAAG